MKKIKSCMNCSRWNITGIIPVIKDKKRYQAVCQQKSQDSAGQVIHLFNRKSDADKFYKQLEKMDKITENPIVKDLDDICTCQFKEASKHLKVVHNKNCSLSKKYET